MESNTEEYQVVQPRHVSPESRNSRHGTDELEMKVNSVYQSEEMYENVLANQEYSAAYPVEEQVTGDDDETVSNVVEQDKPEQVSDVYAVPISKKDRK